MFNTQEYLNELYRLLVQTYDQEFDKIVNILDSAYFEKRSVFVAGNGGNSANAEHLVTDLTKGLFLANGLAMNIQSLTSNVSRFSAIANDLSKEEMFSFSLQMFGLEKTSVVILYSGGGRSKNIAAAAKFSRERGALTIGLLGGIDSPLENEFDYVLRTHSDDIQLVEDVHAVFGHLLYKRLLKTL